MKKRLLLLTFSFIFSYQNFAQTVPQEQRTLLTKVAATWCPPCGTYGWTFFDDILEDNEDKAVLITSHYSGSQLANPVTDAFAANLNTPYQPRFFVNNTDQLVSPSNAPTKRTEIETMVNDNFANAPIANAGIEIFFDGVDIDGNLEIKTKTNFFQAAEGEFYLGVYIVENDVVNFQESIGSDAVHKKILRGAVTDSIFGELLVNGMVDMNTEFDHTFNQEINSDWEVPNLEVVTIIWEKIDETYHVVNTFMQNEIMVLNNKNLELTGAKMIVQPNVISHQANILIDLENKLSDVKLEVFDLFGKKVTDIFQGNLPAGKHSFSLEKSSNLGSGMYFITLQAGEKVLTQKVLFE